MDNSGLNRTICLFFVLLLMAVFFVQPSGAEEAPEQLVVDAEKVIYDQKSNKAIAQGDARLKWENIRLYSPWMELDTENEFVTAVGEEGKDITILQGNQRLYGKKLEYDLKTREGVLYDARGTSPAESGNVYLKGKKVEVAPYESARKKGWIKSDKFKSEEENNPSRWQDVDLTTCPQPEPHYRVVSKKIIFIPGKRIIARSPDVFIGKYKVFKYPFDYIVDLEKNEHNPFMPSIQYDSDKGIGLGLKPRYYIGNARVDMQLVQWSDADFEWLAEIDQPLGNGFSIFAKSSYVYDTDVEEKAYRPSWGVNWKDQGWSGHLKWSEREPRDTELKSGKLYRTTLWRDPEFYIRSPWWKDNTSENSFWSLSATWGDYIEKGEETTRSGVGLHLKGNGNISRNVDYFWRGNYRYYDYESGNTQNVRDGLFGLRFRLGSATLTSSYYKRWVTGSSDLDWDDYDDIEKIYEQLAFPFSKGFRLSLRAAYNLETENLDERIYQVDIDNNCCMKWIIAYRDDLVDDDDWAYLRLIIKAFPNTDLALDTRDVSDRYGD